MKSILASLFAVSLFTTIANADVFIYRGVDKLTVDAQTAAVFNNKNPNLYVVVDFDTGKVAKILFGKINGTKSYTVFFPSDYRFNSVVFPKGKIDTVITTSSTIDNNSNSYTFNITVFRGANTNLLIRKTPVHTVALRPNLLKGTIISASNEATYAEQHIGLTFQGAATIKSNNLNQDIDQALDQVAVGLHDKGYTLIP